jgi:hypothetical protein
MKAFGLSNCWSAKPLLSGKDVRDCDPCVAYALSPLPHCALSFACASGIECMRPAPPAIPHPVEGTLERFGAVLGSSHMISGPA